MPGPASSADSGFVSRLHSRPSDTAKCRRCSLQLQDRPVLIPEEQLRLQLRSSGDTGNAPYIELEMRDILVALLSTAVVAALPESAPADPAAAASNGDISPYQKVVNGVEKRAEETKYTTLGFAWGIHLAVDFK
uniref:Uncharacterized protein n=1 Tax=Pristionchus pacificus TaxID=54126 RepID=A0A2A6BAY8_PRIPA|eukprot:PDM63011.1 hypothetical protein PRIPAC_50226 [Pristionchus pacificus]